MYKLHYLTYALAVLAVELAIICSMMYEPDRLRLFPTEWLVMAAGMSR